MRRTEKKHKLTKRFSHGNKGSSSDHRHYFKKALIYSTVSGHEINIFLKASVPQVYSIALFLSEMAVR